MNKFFKSMTILGCISFLFAGCRSKEEAPPVEAKYPEWAKNAVIYEVNIRQHTPEGTFKAFEKDLPRLKELGVDILWMMPIHPIGELNRKGRLGSYYSVRDYTAVNPEFGNIDDFKSLVKAAHTHGLKVIIDWVANHSAWDNPWMKEHPDWYKKDSLGKFISPFDWTDVVSLNYDNKDMRAAMTAAMLFWITEADIDGFRCDVAGLVPVDFWENTRAELEKAKPLFMLAEDEDKTELCNKAFDMNYGWKMHHLMHQVAQGKMKADTLLKQLQKIDSAFPRSAMQMNFVTNHDENSWNGTVAEKFGEGAKTFTALTYLLPGMPLIYSGQEAGLNKRLRFFEKDTIDWSNKELLPLYQELNKLKHDKEALWNQPFGGKLTVVRNTEPDKVLSFLRTKGEQRILVLANLSPAVVKFNLKDKPARGKYKDYFAKSDIAIRPKEAVELQAWEWKVMIRE